MCQYPQAEGGATGGNVAPRLHHPYHRVVTDMRCWEGEHLTYILAATMGGVLYYPLASFVYPNLQFADKSVDLKFEPTFMIFYQQTRLILAGATTLFPNNNIMVLNTCLSVFLLNAFADYQMEPCLVPCVNNWRLLEFLGSAWACAAAIVLISTEEQLASAVVLGVGCLLLLVVVVWRGHRLQGDAEAGTGIFASAADSEESTGLSLELRSLGETWEEPPPVSERDAFAAMRAEFLEAEQYIAAQGCVTEQDILDVMAHQSNTEISNSAVADQVSPEF